MPDAAQPSYASFAQATAGQANGLPRQQQDQPSAGGAASQAGEQAVSVSSPSAVTIFCSILTP